MHLKLSLTLLLSLYKGEATRTPQLTIDQHYRALLNLVELSRHL